MVRIGTGPPFWQINHANSAYFRLFLGYFGVVSAIRPPLLDLGPPLLTYPGSGPAVHKELNLAYLGTRTLQCTQKSQISLYWMPGGHLYFSLDIILVKGLINTSGIARTLGPMDNEFSGAPPILHIPLMMQWGIWEPLIKQWGNCGELNDLMIRRKIEIGPLVAQWNINLGPFYDAMGKLETLAMMKLGPPNDLMGRLGALDHLHVFFSNGLIWLHFTFSNLWAPNFYWEILDVMQAEKEYIGP